MKQAHQNYQHKKRTMIRFYFGERCKSHHPACFQCAAWQLSPPVRWERTKAGIEEYRAEEAAANPS